MNRITEREDRAREAGAQRILRMSPDGLSGASVTEVLRHRIRELAQAIRDKDLDHLMTFYAGNVEVFDVRASLNVPGANAYRNNLEHWFDSFDGPLGFELHNLRVVPGESTAFCHYLALVTGSRPGGGASGYWARGTTCFERRDGEWLIVHEHISIPSA